MSHLFASHQELWDWMEGFTNLERHVGTHREYRLDRMKTLAAYLGDPQKSFKAIHIAGSKGKGSLAYCLAKTLGATGLSAGIFMSPHVYDWRERLQASDGFFSEDSYLAAGSRLKVLVDSLTLRKEYELGSPTTFELLTLLAFLIFEAEGLGHVVLETGLGGRLDATNICEPVICILTHLELEHTDVLGPTIEHIAYEKAMIAKPKIPLLTLCPRGSALSTIRTTVLSQGGWLMHHHAPELDAEGQRLRLAEICLEHLSIKAPISHALPVGRQSRFESKTTELPTIWADGAHTPDSVAFTLKKLPNREVLIFALASGKRDREILEIVVPQFDHIVITRPGTYKQSDSPALFELARSLGTKAQAVHHETEIEALDFALSLKKPITIIGSFHLLGALWPVLIAKGYEICP